MKENKKKNLVVGITGKIGVGKSTVTKIFQSFGWAIVDADKIGKAVVGHNPAVLKKLAKEFGKDILIHNTILKREVLREKAFKNKKTTKILNKIVHPYLLDELFSQVKKHRDRNKNVIIDAALLLDWNLDKKIDAVVLVHTNKKLRIERMLHRGFSRKAVLEIDKQQKSFYELRRRSDYLIYNSTSEKELRIKVERLLNKLKN